MNERGRSKKKGFCSKARDEDAETGNMDTTNADPSKECGTEQERLIEKKLGGSVQETGETKKGVGGIRGTQEELSPSIQRREEWYF